MLCGDDLMLIPLVAFATLCAQTHVPYLTLAVGLVALGFGAVIVRTVRAGGDGRRRPIRLMAWAAGIGVLLWLPPVADQLTNEPGNIRELIDHFGSPPEAAIGLGEGIRLALRHLDVWSGLAEQVTGTARFVTNASAGRGAVVLVAVAGVRGAGLAHRHAPRCDRCTSSWPWRWSSAPPRWPASSVAPGST